MDQYLFIIEKSFTYVRPVLELGILWLMIYGLLYYLRGTRGANILAGIVIALILLTLVSDLLKLEVISAMLLNLWAILATALIVIFQPELRRAFAQLGSASFLAQRRTRQREAISEIVTATVNMAKRRIGAIMVFERQIGMGAIVEDAIKLDGKLNSYLLESIFFPNSPLHDGAVIIRDDRIVAAHAILPLAQIDASLPSMGTRHRAALGITEETDAVALVISEESGAISLACRGRIKRRIPPEKLPRFLLGLLLDKDADSPLSGSMNNGLPENDDVSLNKE